MCGVKVIYLAQMVYLDNQLWATTKKQNKKKRYTGCLAHLVSGMIYSVVANRPQPNLYKIEGRVTVRGKGYPNPGGGVRKKQTKKIERKTFTRPDQAFSKGVANVFEL